jgi:hypothetical protein
MWHVSSEQIVVVVFFVEMKTVVLYCNALVNKFL